MKRKMLMIIGCVFLVVVVGAGLSVADGPAPNAGDCVPDGSGFNEPNGSVYGPGPAPNAGDGIPDGPGW